VVRNAIRSALLASSLLLLAACGPHWTVVKQATPNPMSRSTSFFVAPVSFDGLRVGEKTEFEWMSEKSDDTRASWKGDKAGMNDEFVEGFGDAHGPLVVAGAPNGAFTVRPRFVRYEPGFYAGVVSGNAEVDATIDVVDPAGNVVDEFETSAQASGFSAGERARNCAHAIGITAAKYLRARLGM